MSSHSHSHSHPHSHDPASGSGASDSTSSHDYVEANKRHHNEHAHHHAESVLSEYLAGKSADAILDAYDFDEEETTCLDYACGSGMVAQKLAPYTKRIVGVDVSQAMVDRFNLQVEQHGVDPSEMVAYQKDVLLDTAEELNGELFDVVFCSQAFHHIKDVKALTLALSRRVKPEGVLIVIDLDSESDFAEMRARANHKRKDELEKVVAHKGGFSNAELVDLLEGSGRFSEVTCEISHSTKLSEMKALKGPGNWSSEINADRDLEIRHLIAVGVRKED